MVGFAGRECLIPNEFYEVWERYSAHPVSSMPLVGYVPLPPTNGALNTRAARRMSRWRPHFFGSISHACFGVALAAGAVTTHLPRSAICTVASCALSLWLAGEKRVPPTDKPIRNTVAKARPSIAPSPGEGLRLTPDSCFAKSSQSCWFIF